MRFVPAVTCSFFPILVYAYAVSNKLTCTGKNKMMVVGVGGGFFLTFRDMGEDEYSPPELFFLLMD